MNFLIVVDPDEKVIYAIDETAESLDIQNYIDKFTLDKS